MLKKTFILGQKTFFLYKHIDEIKACMHLNKNKKVSSSDPLIYDPAGGGASVNALFEPLNFSFKIINTKSINEVYILKV